jgi:RNA-directed DNA polymerase
MVHRFVLGQLDEKELAYLRGFLAFVKAVEPVFLTRLRRKYGRKIIAEILHADTVKRK